MLQDVVVDSLAVYRLTRLVQRDTLPPVKRARDVVVDSDRTPPWAVELLECPWCLSFWIGVGVVAARRWAPRPWSVVGAALAASAVTGLLTHAEED